MARTMTREERRNGNPHRWREERRAGVRSAPTRADAARTEADRYDAPRDARERRVR